MIYYRILLVATEQRLKLWPDGPLLFDLFLCKLCLNRTFWEVLLSNNQLWDFTPKRILHLFEGKSDTNRISLRKVEASDDSHLPLQQPKEERLKTKTNMHRIAFVSVTQIRSWEIFISLGKTVFNAVLTLYCSHKPVCIVYHQKTF